MSTVKACPNTMARIGEKAALVCLLGFLSPFELRGRYAGKTLNVHPALIPALSGKGFYGHHVHEAFFESWRQTDRRDRSLRE